MTEAKRNNVGKPRKVPSKEAMLLKMATLCARSEQCPADIRKKLKSRGLSASECDEIITELTDRKFISEERFARSFASDKVRFSSWGKLKIRKALYTKQIPAAIIEEAVSLIPNEDYKEALIRSARSKASSLNLTEPADRMKLFKFLISRGFESNLAMKLIQKIKVH